MRPGLARLRACGLLALTGAGLIGFGVLPHVGPLAACAIGAGLFAAFHPPLS